MQLLQCVKGINYCLKAYFSSYGYSGILIFLIWNVSLLYHVNMDNNKQYIYSLANWICVSINVNTDLSHIIERSQRTSYDKYWMHIS